MAITKTITPTNRSSRAAVGVLTSALVIFAGFNLLFTLSPQTQMNEKIAVRLDAAEKLPYKEKIDAMNQLRAQQETALARIPAEPYAWARLSYLRKMTAGGDEAAFDALRLSDTVSPNEPRQMLERALMWREQQKSGKEEDKKHQDQLWEKAFTFQPDDTWNAAVQKGLLAEVSAALLRTNRELYGAWQERIEERRKKMPATEMLAPSSGEAPAP